MSSHLSKAESSLTKLEKTSKWQWTPRLSALQAISYGLLTIVKKLEGIDERLARIEKAIETDDA